MLCWARQLFIALVAILGISQMMAACGQKGPLFLPEEKADKQEAPRKPPAKSPQDDPAPEIPGPEATPAPVR
jgi:predicted small lipoprotein YifL